MTTDKEPTDLVEEFLERRRARDAARGSPLIAGQMCRPATAADLVRSAKMGARDLNPPPNIR